MSAAFTREERASLDARLLLVFGPIAGDFASNARIIQTALKVVIATLFVGEIRPSLLVKRV